MFVIRKSTVTRDGLGNLFRHSTYANASFYVQDLKRDGGKSKAKTYVLWCSGDDVDSRPHGITRFESEFDAQRVLDHYPMAFGKGCKVVSVQSVRDERDAWKEYEVQRAEWRLHKRANCPVNPCQVHAEPSRQV